VCVWVVAPLYTHHRRHHTHTHHHHGKYHCRERICGGGGTIVMRKHRLAPRATTLAGVGASETERVPTDGERVRGTAAAAENERRTGERNAAGASTRVIIGGRGTWK